MITILNYITPDLLLLFLLIVIGLSISVFLHLKTYTVNRSGKAELAKEPTVLKILVLFAFIVWLGYTCYHIANLEIEHFH
ncbi:hypothetical protein [Aquimarina spongiae]|uniref:Uncharacterized protein n=1 Tax=Aquimarina spongiae TaxID=570521 RepID=A0A1M6JE13_9FLAO|nr:hypothetical protein [Aquimarina spongiae]SHJ44947.1 hypothetical protein SAMN04488508_10915 [Aquimarina spongiae]